MHRLMMPKAMAVLVVNEIVVVKAPVFAASPLATNVVAMAEAATDAASFNSRSGRRKGNHSLTGRRRSRMGSFYQH